MSDLYKKAYYTYRNQRSRCYNKNDRCFSHYGEEGIEVRYDRADFIEWFLKNYPYKNAGFNQYVVGRIDHKKDYSFDNIRFETMQESGLEVAKRLKKEKKICLFNFRTGEELIIFSSIHSAAKSLDLDKSSIQNQCKNRILNKKRKSPPRSGFAFKFWR